MGQAKRFPKIIIKYEEQRENLVPYSMNGHLVVHVQQIAVLAK
jgi:hypothetical protein